MLKGDAVEESPFCLLEQILLILSQDENSTLLYQAHKWLEQQGGV